MLKRILVGLAIIVVAFAAFVAWQVYHYPKPQVASATEQGAPDFSLPRADGGVFTLSTQRGHRTVLYFYRGYW